MLELTHAGSWVFLLIFRNFASQLTSWWYLEISHGGTIHAMHIRDLLLSPQLFICQHMAGYLLCVCVCVKSSGTGFCWGRGSAFCHFLMESMLVGSKVGIPKWNINANLGSDVWLSWRLFFLSFSFFIQKNFRLNKMISKIFQPPIYDFGKVLMHILFFSFLKKKKNYLFGCAGS